MKKDLEFFSHLNLIAAGILAVAGFVLLLFLLKPTSSLPERAKPVTTPPKTKEEPEKEYFEDQNFFLNKDFGFTFYYPQDWFMTDNGSYRKDALIDVDKAEILSGWVISTYNNPDYQIGKQAALIVKVVNKPQGSLTDWLLLVSREPVALDNIVKTYFNSQTLFYFIDSARYQIYSQLPSGEILIFTAPCGLDTTCLGNRDENQKMLETILSSLTF